MHFVKQIVSDMYCGVSTPLGCAVVLLRAMLGYLCKLLDEGGTKKWKITKILDSPIAAWPRRPARRQQRPRPLIWMVGCEHGHHRHRHSLHVIGTTRPGLAWHNSILPCLDWLWVCGIQFLQSLHSPEKWNILWIYIMNIMNILRKL